MNHHRSGTNFLPLHSAFTMLSFRIASTQLKELKKSLKLNTTHVHQATHATPREDCKKSLGLPTMGFCFHLPGKLPLQPLGSNSIQLTHSCNAPVTTQLNNATYFTWGSPVSPISEHTRIPRCPGCSHKAFGHDHQIDFNLK